MSDGMESLAARTATNNPSQFRNRIHGFRHGSTENVIGNPLRTKRDSTVVSDAVDAVRSSNVHHASQSSCAAIALARQNCVLRNLPESELARMLAHMELINMTSGEVLHESSAPRHHVYFPITSIVSLLCVMTDGATSEVGIIGNEGMVGVALFMGGESTPCRAIVQGTGQGYRLNGRFLQGEFSNRSVLQRLLLRYSQALLTQMAQNAVCNRHHSVVQQLSRRLLLSLDRLESNQIDMTQEMLASVLGVRRAGVTAAACKLQSAGIIAYHRGHITVLDRLALEAQACECYGLVKTEFDRLLPDVANF